MSASSRSLDKTNIELTIPAKAREGIRLQSFHGIMMNVASPMLVERTLRGDDMFMTLLGRHCKQVLDLDALSLLPEHANLTRPWLVRAPTDEGLHPPGIEYLWNESCYFDVVDEKQDVGCWIRMGLYSNQGLTWYTAVICGRNIPTVAVIDYHASLSDEELVLRGGLSQPRKIGCRR